MKHRDRFLTVAFLVLALMIGVGLLGQLQRSSDTNTALQSKLNDREMTLHQMLLDKDRLMCEKAELEKQLISTRMTEGVVSWYGDREHGRLTANGERFDRYSFTIASRTLPFGTLVMVENLETGKFAPAIVNDRGPYIDGRIADLSEALALKLGFHEQGLVMARVYEVRKTT